MCHNYSVKTIDKKDELNLVTLAQQYADEDRARALLESLLWANDLVCPLCENRKKQ